MGCYLKRSNVTLGCKETLDKFTFTKYLTFGIHPYSRLIMQDLVFPRGYVTHAFVEEAGCTILPTQSEMFANLLKTSGRPSPKSFV